jgi:adenylate kinase
MNLILIAPPAAGKGTFASYLHDNYNLVCISAGELLRGVNPDSELGKEIRELQARRELVDDRITNNLMKQRLMKDDVKNGFVLDGYPRHMPQVEAVTEICKELNLHIDYAILLNVDYDTALKRTIGRQICPKCKKTYNRLTGVNTPKVENMCDDCHVELTVRNDDNEEAFNIGYNAYLKNCAPVIEYYRNQGILVEIDASKSLENTINEFKQKVGSKE